MSPFIQLQLNKEPVSEHSERNTIGSGDFRDRTDQMVAYVTSYHLQKSAYCFWVDVLQILVSP